MFNIFAKTKLPVAEIDIETISVRGDLGPLTVWCTPDSFFGKEASPEAWQCVYEAEHQPSHELCPLQLTTPINVKAGQGVGIYVHSKLRGDRAIIYDNQRSQNNVSFENLAMQVRAGLAHLSHKPFGQQGPWGSAWRRRREFVGRLHYGCRYLLWNPEVHTRFPLSFQKVVQTFLLCEKREESPVSLLDFEVILYILNKCGWDWFENEESVSDRRAQGLEDPTIQASIDQEYGESAEWEQRYGRQYDDHMYDMHFRAARNQQHQRASRGGRFSRGDCRTQ